MTALIIIIAALAWVFCGLVAAQCAWQKIEDDVEAAVGAVFAVPLWPLLIAWWVLVKVWYAAGIVARWLGLVE